MGDIAIKNISFSYEEGGKVILKDIDTRIHAGSSYVFLVSRDVGRVRCFG